MQSEARIKNRIDELIEDNMRLSRSKDQRQSEIQIAENRMMIGVLNWVLSGVD